MGLLENISTIKFNYNLYNLIENTNHEFPATTEEVKIRALEFLWPLLRTKIIIRMLDKLFKLLVTSETIEATFTHGFFP